MSEDQDKNPEATGKVEVTDEGKATPTEQTVEKIKEIQATDPSIQTTSEPSDAPAAEIQEDVDAEKEAKLKANREARAARDAARAEAAKLKAAEAAGVAGATGAAKAVEGDATEPEQPKAPSPNQPKLDRIVQIIKESIGEQAVVEAYINEKDRELPCLIIDKNHWLETALLLRDNPELELHYLRNVSGTDQETHMEVAYYLINLNNKQDYFIKVKTDRDGGEIPSVTSVWQTANWNEREIYDLLGVNFSDHPDLRRIMMPDDWVGYPLRKDYEPIDPEV
ncbi:MAG: NADH-quinone oxidoreductase subunit C [Paenibacillaceae bacterium]